ncbi:MAG: helix-turn-helix domain-containing protein, partial [Actinomyces sp.]|uniref:TetR/AcrR family transcriptional regulator n=1 Tax=Actinomyces sp. TaxID=29317 RepID=UPI0026DC2AC3
MRRSNRDRIVAGALELAGRKGYDHLTFEAVAEHTGLTRGGVVYHFHNRESLIEAIADHLLDRWRTQALTALGKPFDSATR